MKRWLLLFFVLGTMPMTMAAQDDDMYFVPSRQSVQRTSPYGSVHHGTYYSGSNRSIDEYNRRGGSFWEVMPGDTAHNDIIDFAPEVGVYPDSTGVEYGITHQLRRFDGYEPSSSYWAGYAAGRLDSWHSPWYYSSWYYPWYDSWYYNWYGWYDPWYYSYYYYDPWYYYGWGGHYYGWGGAYTVSGRHGGNSLANRSYSGSIRNDGGTRGSNFSGFRGGGGVRTSTASTALGSTRYNSARNRTVGTHSSYNNSYSNSSSSSGNFSGSRSAFNNSVTSTPSSFSGGGGGGSVTRGGGGGGGGGGSRGGGISAGGRR